MTYEIVTRDRGAIAPYEWRNDELGGPNEFASIVDAREAAQSLFDQGDEWEECVYGIRVVGETVILEHWQRRQEGKPL